VAEALDPEGFERRVAQYVEWLRISHFSEATARTRAKRLGYFVAWCADRGLTRPAEITRPILEGYQASLFYYRKANGDPLALVSQANQITSLKGFFKWLVRSNYLLSNPASDLVVPRLTGRLPKHVLTEEEVERVLAVPDVETPTGLRDRAILEVLYSTGLRRMEVAGLALYDLDMVGRTLRVREGKGRRERVVPIGKRAVAWVEKYLHEVRPRFVVPPDEGWLFLTQDGQRFPRETVSEMARRHIVRAGIGKPGSAHVFRHTCATLMLEGGADVRYVQEMLGHVKLETTAIYTHVSIQKLQQVHDATHPADRAINGRADSGAAGDKAQAAAE